MIKINKGFKKKQWKQSKHFWRRKKKNKTPERYQNFFEKEKEKKSQSYRERNKSLYEDQKQRLVEYRRYYYITQKVTAWVA